MAATMKDDHPVLGAAITRGIANLQPSAACPSLEELAALVDGAHEAARRDSLLGHLAACDRCRELYLAATELAREEECSSAGLPQGKPRRAYLFASALAAAAVLILAVTLQQSPLSDKKELAAGKAEPQPQVAALEPASSTAPPASTSSTASTASTGSTGSTGSTAPANKPAPAGTFQLARQLARQGDPKELAALASVQERVSGFAVKGDASSLAFRTGMHLMGLELALLADDGDRAQAQAARLAPLLESLAGSGHAAALERMVASLETGEAPARLAGKGGELERLLPRELVPFARLGAWAQGVRVAARTGNREYLAAGVPRYLPAEALPPVAAVALRNLERTLKQARSADPEQIEVKVSALLEAF